MRGLMTAVLLLVALFSLACSVEIPSQRGQLDTAGTLNGRQEIATEWRRTNHGWERYSDWFSQDPPLPTATRIHPILVAALQMLISLGALVAFCQPVASSSVQSQTRR